VSAESFDGNPAPRDCVLIFSTTTARAVILAAYTLTTQVD
jgi:hypothetical protein